MENKKEYLGIGGVALLGAILLGPGIKPQNLKNKNFNETENLTKEKVTQILESDSKYFFNPLLKSEKPYINPKAILFPIGIEESKKTKGEFKIEVKNFYENGGKNNPYFSNVKEKFEKEMKHYFEIEISNIIDESYKPQTQSKINIIFGESIGKSTPEGLRSENDFGVINPSKKSEEINNKINKGRAESIFNDFIKNVKNFSQLNGIENVKIDSEIIPFSDEEIGKLYSIALKYADKNKENGEYDAIMNLIKIYDENPNNFEQTDKEILFQIIDSKRVSELKIYYEGEGFNRKISYSYLNILVLMLYSIMIVGYAYKKTRI